MVMAMVVMVVSTLPWMLAEIIPLLPPAQRSNTCNQLEYRIQNKNTITSPWMGRLRPRNSSQTWGMKMTTSTSTSTTGTRFVLRWQVKVFKWWSKTTTTMIILKLLSHQWKWYIQKKTFSVAATSCLSFLLRDTWNDMYFDYFLIFFFNCDLYLVHHVFWTFSKMFLNCDLYLVHLAGELDGSEGGAGGHLWFSEEIETIVYWGSCAQPHIWYMEKNTNVQSESIPTQPTIPFSIALFSVK